LGLLLAVEKIDMLLWLAFLGADDAGVSRGYG
jgi:hypothetical protein